MSLILEAARYATKMHEGQVRKWCGEPYIRHPGRVAARLMEFGDAGEDQVAAAWLHDVLEDCQADRDDIEWVTNSRVVHLVEELTNTSKQLYPLLNRDNRKSIDFARLAKTSFEARRIKLLDRIDNLHSLRGAPLDFVRLYAQESVALLNALQGSCPRLEIEMVNVLDSLRVAASG